MKCPGKLRVTFFRLADKPYDIKQSASMRGKKKHGIYMPDIIWGNMSPRMRGLWRTHSHHSHANLLPSLSSVTLRLDDFICYNCNSCGPTEGVKARSVTVPTTTPYPPYTQGEWARSYQKESRWLGNENLYFFRFDTPIIFIFATEHPCRFYRIYQANFHLYLVAVQAIYNKSTRD